jgi:GntR family transcriptional regulator/MocR family aminotransferase
MTVSRTSSGPELLVPLRREDPQPLARQLEQQLRDAVRSERLAADAPLPSSRALAAQVGVARGVVVAAYEQLVAEGYLVSRPGGSTRVARVPGTPARPRPATNPAPFEFDFRPGRPDLREFPRAAWLKSVRRVMAAAPASSLGYLDGHGAAELRDALATYLNRLRGTCISPHDIVISTGFAQGIQLVVTALLATGARRIGLEDPYHPDYRAMITALGADAVPVPIDDDGMRVDLLDGLDLDAVVVTPAHQYPTGAVLSAERRAALLEWADRSDGTIIEDDYDAEFRYDRDPIGAVQGLCSDRIVYAGTASKTLAPGLRLGWLAAPRRLVEPISAAKMAADHGSDGFEQLALADFIEQGELDRNLRRVRPIYRRRRDAMLDALRRHLPQATPVGASAGLHLLAWLPPDADDIALVARAAEAGIGLIPASTGWCGAEPRPGLVLGYAATDEDRIDAGVARLATLVR